MQPFLKRAGVTRIADITGLDHIGVPTTLALRPNAPTMACSSGKGTTLIQAYVSGAMEALELYAAETADLAPVRGSYRSMSSTLRLPPVSHLPLTEHSLFDPDWPFKWCVGWDVLTQTEVAVPTATVGMARESMAGSLRAFLASSNGLGAGNSFLEALASALYEVIERDGVACHYHAALHRGRPSPIVPSRHLRARPLVAELVARCEAADVEVVVLDSTVDTNVPIYNAYVYDRRDLGVPVTRGSGAHLDPEIALLRAITEALQGRLNFIAGSRDDLFRSAYSRARAGWAQTVAALGEMRRLAPEAEVGPSTASDSFDEDVKQLLDRLRGVGLPNVVVFDLTPDGFPVTVVRVVAPGLEGYMHHGYAAGFRARAFEGIEAA